MTGAEGGTHNQDKYPQKLRQELLKDVPPQAKSLLHLHLRLIFHFFFPLLPPLARVSTRLFLRQEQTAHKYEGDVGVIVGAGCRLPLGALGPWSGEQAGGRAKLCAPVPLCDHQGVHSLTHVAVMSSLAGNTGSTFTR